MPPLRLPRRHDPASRTKFQELKELARSQRRILAGSPGTLKQRTQSGNRYWVREYMRVDGRKADEYLGPESSIGKARLAELRAEIELAKALASGSAKLRLFAYQRIDRKPAAVLEVFFNRGLTRAGLTLVGSHAYGALLNELGVTAPAYRTQDVDVARAEPLALAVPSTITLKELLDETGLKFVPVPGLPSHRPSASFKLPGAETLTVDLLVPGGEVGRVVPVRELGTHAQTIPLLDFLVEDPLEGIVLSPNQIIPVKLPAPERFVLHKLFSSQSRKTARDKVRKDLEQAVVLAAVVQEDTPGALSDVFREIPPERKATVARGARAAATLLAGTSPEAESVLRRIAGRYSR